MRAEGLEQPAEVELPEDTHGLRVTIADPSGNKTQEQKSEGLRKPSMRGNTSTETHTVTKRPRTSLKVCSLERPS